MSQTRTPPGWNLLCRGPANHVKDGVFPLEGLVETDWGVVPFSMSWKLTRPGRCEFREGEPIAMLVPHRRSDLEAFKPRFAELRENLEMEQEYTAWIKARQEFWEARQRDGSDAARQQFQKDYLRGVSTRGEHFAEHQTGRRLNAFERKIAQPPIPTKE